MLKLRAATTEDAGLITQFIQELAEYEKLAHECQATEAAIREQLFGANPAAQVVIAEWNGAAAGFALYFPTFSTFLARPGIYLEDLYVRSEFRGKGIGKALLRHLARVAVEQGYGRLEWSVLKWNAPSIAFYESLGALPKEGWTDYRLSGERLLRAAELE
ncbi:MAG: GNAT family N-acetyltransferase [Bryobacter sp.]|nr:GNAT family N-acetyltransferase [Bryobacter sp.]